ncbi:MAG: tRNA (guanosine(46)-N7)-methyltransferase TrmB [Oscillospiraceae bacterium]
MRKKKNLDTRLEHTGGRILYMDRPNRDHRLAETERTLIDLAAVFGNTNPLALEIGCGKGQFACEAAKRDPNTNFLAVEQSSNVILSAAERAEQENIPNLRFLRGGAEYLACYIPPASVRTIYLNFSCPFPKNTYAVHRLTHRRFLEIYKGLLLPGGEIHQKTDAMGLFEFSLAEFSQNGFRLKNISLDLHNSPFTAENIITEYEAKFVAEGKPIYRLEAY